MKKEKIIEGGIFKSILVLSGPLIAGMLLQNLFNIIDTFWIAKLGANAIAALSMSFPVIFFMIGIGMGISIGVSSLVARSIGSGKYHRLQKILSNGLIMALFLTVFFTIVGLWTIGPVFGFMGATPEILKLIKQYMGILYLGVFTIFFGMIFNAVLQGEGDTKTPTKALFVAIIINIILDPLLIFGIWFFPELGVRGAALATIISRSIGGIYIISYFVRGKAKTALKFENHEIGFDWKISKKILKVGLPSSINQGLISLGIYALNMVVALFGPVALAGFGIGARLRSLAVLPSAAISNANLIVIGQNIGAKKFNRVKKSAVISALITFCFMGLIGLILFLFPDFLLRIFTDDLGVISAGVSYLKIIGPVMGLIGISMVMEKSFQATGHAIPSMIITLFRLIIITIPLAYYLAVIRGIGLIGVWYGFAISIVVTSIVSTTWFFIHIKKLKEKNRI